MTDILDSALQCIIALARRLGRADYYGVPLMNMELMQYSVDELFQELNHYCLELIQFGEPAAILHTFIVRWKTVPFDYQHYHAPLLSSMLLASIQRSPYELSPGPADYFFTLALAKFVEFFPSCAVERFFAETGDLFAWQLIQAAFDCRMHLLCRLRLRVVIKLAYYLDQRTLTGLFRREVLDKISPRYLKNSTNQRTVIPLLDCSYLEAQILRVFTSQKIIDNVSRHVLKISFAGLIARIISRACHSLDADASAAQGPPPVCPAQSAAESAELVERCLWYVKTKMHTFMRWLYSWKHSSSVFPLLTEYYVRVPDWRTTKNGQRFLSVMLDQAVDRNSASVPYFVRLVALVYFRFDILYDSLPAYQDALRAGDPAGPAPAAAGTRAPAPPLPHAYSLGDALGATLGATLEGASQQGVSTISDSLRAPESAVSASAGPDSVPALDRLSALVTNISAIQPRFAVPQTDSDAPGGTPGDGPLSKTVPPRSPAQSPAAAAGPATHRAPRTARASSLFSGMLPAPASVARHIRPNPADARPRDRYFVDGLAKVWRNISFTSFATMPSHAGIVRLADFDLYPEHFVPGAEMARRVFDGVRHSRLLNTSFVRTVYFYLCAYATASFQKEAAELSHECFAFLCLLHSISPPVIGEALHALKGDMPGKAAQAPSGNALANFATRANTLPNLLALIVAGSYYHGEESGDYLSHMYRPNYSLLKYYNGQPDCANFIVLNLCAKGFNDSVATDVVAPALGAVCENRLSDLVFERGLSYLFRPIVPDDADPYRAQDRRELFVTDTPGLWWCADAGGGDSDGDASDGNTISLYDDSPGRKGSGSGSGSGPGPDPDQAPPHKGPFAHSFLESVPGSQTTLEVAKVTLALSNILLVLKRIRLFVIRARAAGQAPTSYAGVAGNGYAQLYFGERSLTNTCRRTWTVQHLPFLVQPRQAASTAGPPFSLASHPSQHSQHSHQQQVPQIQPSASLSAAALLHEPSSSIATTPLNQSEALASTRMHSAAPRQDSFPGGPPGPRRRRAKNAREDLSASDWTPSEANLSHKLSLVLRYTLNALLVARERLRAPRVFRALGELEGCILAFAISDPGRAPLFFSFFAGVGALFAGLEHDYAAELHARSLCADGARAAPGPALGLAGPSRRGASRSSANIAAAPDALNTSLNPFAEQPRAPLQVRGRSLSSGTAAAVAAAAAVVGPANAVDASGAPPPASPGLSATSHPPAAHKIARFAARDIRLTLPADDAGGADASEHSSLARRPDTRRFDQGGALSLTAPAGLAPTLSELCSFRPMHHFLMGFVDTLAAGQFNAFLDALARTSPPGFAEYAAADSLGAAVDGAALLEDLHLDAAIPPSLIGGPCGGPDGGPCGGSCGGSCDDAPWAHAAAGTGGGAGARASRDSNTLDRLVLDLPRPPAEGRGDASTHSRSGPDPGSRVGQRLCIQILHQDLALNPDAWYAALARPAFSTAFPAQFAGVWEGLNRSFFVRSDARLLLSLARSRLEFTAGPDLMNHDYDSFLVYLLATVEATPPADLFAHLLATAEPCRFYPWWSINRMQTLQELCNTVTGVARNLSAGNLRLLEASADRPCRCGAAPDWPGGAAQPRRSTALKNFADEGARAAEGSRSRRNGQQRRADEASLFSGTSVADDALASIMDRFAKTNEFLGAKSLMLAVAGVACLSVAGFSVAAARELCRPTPRSSYARHASVRWPDPAGLKKSGSGLLGRQAQRALMTTVGAHGGRDGGRDGLPRAARLAEKRAARVDPRLLASVIPQSPCGSATSERPALASPSLRDLAAHRVATEGAETAAPMPHPPLDNYLFYLRVLGSVSLFYCCACVNAVALMTPKQVAQAGIAAPAVAAIHQLLRLRGEVVTLLPGFDTLFVATRRALLDAGESGGADTGASASGALGLPGVFGALGTPPEASPPAPDAGAGARRSFRGRSRSRASESAAHAPPPDTAPQDAPGAPGESSSPAPAPAAADSSGIFARLHQMLHSNTLDRPSQRDGGAEAAVSHVYVHTFADLPAAGDVRKFVAKASKPSRYKYYRTRARCVAAMLGSPGFVRSCADLLHRLRDAALGMARDRGASAAGLAPRLTELLFETSFELAMHQQADLCLATLSGLCANAGLFRGVVECWHYSNVANLIAATQYIDLEAHGRGSGRDGEDGGGAPALGAARRAYDAEVANSYARLHTPTMAGRADKGLSPQRETPSSIHELLSVPHTPDFVRRLQSSASSASATSLQSTSFYAANGMGVDTVAAFIAALPRVYASSADNTTMAFLDRLRQTVRALYEGGPFAFSPRASRLTSGARKFLAHVSTYDGLEFFAISIVHDLEAREGSVLGQTPDGFVEVDPRSISNYAAFAAQAVGGAAAGVDLAGIGAGLAGGESPDTGSASGTVSASQSAPPSRGPYCSDDLAGAPCPLPGEAGSRPNVSPLAVSAGLSSAGKEPSAASTGLAVDQDDIDENFGGDFDSLLLKARPAMGLLAIPSRAPADGWPRQTPSESGTLAVTPSVSTAQGSTLDSTADTGSSSAFDDGDDTSGDASGAGSRGRAVQGAPRRESSVDSGCFEVCSSYANRFRGAGPPHTLLEAPLGATLAAPGHAAAAAHTAALTRVALYQQSTSERQAATPLASAAIVTESLTKVLLVYGVLEAMEQGELLALRHPMVPATVSPRLLMERAGPAVYDATCYASDVRVATASLGGYLNLPYAEAALSKAVEPHRTLSCVEGMDKVSILSYDAICLLVNLAYALQSAQSHLLIDAGYRLLDQLRSGASGSLTTRWNAILRVDCCACAPCAGSTSNTGNTGSISWAASAPQTHRSTGRRRGRASGVHGVRAPRARGDACPHCGLPRREDYLPSSRRYIHDFAARATVLTPGLLRTASRMWFYLPQRLRDNIIVVLRVFAAQFTRNYFLISHEFVSMTLGVSRAILPWTCNRVSPEALRRILASEDGKGLFGDVGNELYFPAPAPAAGAGMGMGAGAGPTADAGPGAAAGAEVGRGPLCEAPITFTFQTGIVPARSLILSEVFLSVFLDFASKSTKITDAFTGNIESAMVGPLTYRFLLFAIANRDINARTEIANVESDAAARAAIVSLARRVYSSVPEAAGDSQRSTKRGHRREASAFQPALLQPAASSASVSTSAYQQDSAASFVSQRQDPALSRTMTSVMSAEAAGSTIPHDDYSSASMHPPIFTEHGAGGGAGAGGGDAGADAGGPASHLPAQMHLLGSSSIFAGAAYQEVVNTLSPVLLYNIIKLLAKKDQRAVYNELRRFISLFPVLFDEAGEQPPGLCRVAGTLPHPADDPHAALRAIGRSFDAANCSIALRPAGAPGAPGAAAVLLPAPAALALHFAPYPVQIASVYIAKEFFCNALSMGLILSGAQPGSARTPRPSAAASASASAAQPHGPQHAERLSSSNLSSKVDSVAPPQGEAGYYDVVVESFVGLFVNPLLVRLTPPQRAAPRKPSYWAAGSLGDLRSNNVFSLRSASRRSSQSNLSDSDAGPLVSRRRQRGEAGSNLKAVVTADDGAPSDDLAYTSSGDSAPAGCATPDTELLRAGDASTPKHPPQLPGQATSPIAVRGISAPEHNTPSDRGSGRLLRQSSYRPDAAPSQYKTPVFGLRSGSFLSPTPLSSEGSVMASMQSRLGSCVSQGDDAVQGVLPEARVYIEPCSSSCGELSNMFGSDHRLAESLEQERSFQRSPLACTLYSMSNERADSQTAFRLKTIFVKTRRLHESEADYVAGCILSLDEKCPGALFLPKVVMYAAASACLAGCSAPRVADCSPWFLPRRDHGGSPSVSLFDPAAAAAVRQDQAQGQPDGDLEPSADVPLPLDQFSRRSLEIRAALIAKVLLPATVASQLQFASHVAPLWNAARGAECPPAIVSLASAYTTSLEYVFALLANTAILLTQRFLPALSSSLATLCRCVHDLAAGLYRLLHLLPPGAPAFARAMAAIGRMVVSMLAVRLQPVALTACALLRTLAAISCTAPGPFFAALAEERRALLQPTTEAVYVLFVDCVRGLLPDVYRGGRRVLLHPSELALSTVIYSTNDALLSRMKQSLIAFHHTLADVYKDPRLRGGLNPAAQAPVKEEARRLAGILGMTSQLEGCASGSPSASAGTGAGSRFLTPNPLLKTGYVCSVLGSDSPRGAPQSPVSDRYAAAARGVAQRLLGRLAAALSGASPAGAADSATAAAAGAGVPARVSASLTTMTAAASQYAESVVAENLQAVALYKKKETRIITLMDIVSFITIMASPDSAYHESALNVCLLDAPLVCALRCARRGLHNVVLALELVRATFLRIKNGRNFVQLLEPLYFHLTDSRFAGVAETLIGLDTLEGPGVEPFLRNAAPLPTVDFLMRTALDGERVRAGEFTDLVLILILRFPAYELSAALVLLWYSRAVGPLEVTRVTYKLLSTCSTTLVSPICRYVLSWAKPRDKNIPLEFKRCPESNHGLASMLELFFSKASLPDDIGSIPGL